MTATQTQLRRDTNANLVAATPATGELGYNTTNKRLHVGDGSTLGGTILPNAFDIQSQAHTSGTVGGTGDAITLTLTPGPTAYASPQTFVFKAGADNTTATTINVNTLGVKTIKKMKSGALVDLVASDIKNGGIYFVTYDGTNFQIKALDEATSPGLPTAVTGTLSGASTTFTVDFTTYSAYRLYIDEATLTSGSGSCTIQVSSNGGSTYATSTAVSKIITGTTVTAGSTDFKVNSGTTLDVMADIFQPATSGHTFITNISGDTASGIVSTGVGDNVTAAAVNRVKITTGTSTFSGGAVVLQPISLR